VAFTPVANRQILWGTVCTGDLDGDGSNELVCGAEDGSLSVLDENGRSRVRKRMAEGWALHGAMDVDGDGRDEAVVSVQQGVGRRFDLLGLSGNRMRLVKSLDLRPRAFRSFAPAQVEHVEACCVICDRSGNGAGGGPTIIVGWDLAGRRDPSDSNSGWRDRRVCAYEAATSEELWSHALGPRVDSLAVGDIDGDGFPEVLVGTNSIANGYESNGTDDSHVYLIALRHDGRLLWRTRPLGGYFLGAVVCLAQLHGDGRPEIIAAVSGGHPQRDDHGALYLLDARSGGVDRTYECGYSLVETAVGDVSGDSRVEIVTGGRDGLVRVFDGKLRPQHSIPLRAPAYVQAVADLDRDGKAEIVAITSDWRVVVVDCSPGYPSPTLSEFQFCAGASPSTYCPGRALVTSVATRGDPRLQIAAWFTSPDREAATLRLLRVDRADLPALRGTVRRLSDSRRRVSEFAWDPFGQRLALVEEAQGRDQLRLVNAGGSGLRDLFRSDHLTAPCFGAGNRLAVIEPALDGPRPDAEFGRCLMLNLADAAAKPVRVAGAEFGPPVWNPALQEWLCAAHDRRGWWVTAISVQSEVRACTPPTAEPLGPRVAVMRAGKQILLSRSLTYTIPRAEPQRAAGCRTQVYCLDLGTGKEVPVVTVPALTRALQSGAHGFDATRVADWLSESQSLLPGVAGPSRRTSEPARPVPVPMAVSPGGEAVALPLTLARYIRQPGGGDWVANSPHDLWVWNAPRSGDLQRATTSDDAFETNPSWSPDGRWLAYEVERQDLSSPSPEIWISTPGRPGGSKLTEGSAPAWRPGDGKRSELAFLRKGQLWLADIGEPVVPKPPFYEVAVFPYAAGGSAGVLAVVLVVVLGLVDRTRGFLRSMYIAMQALSRSRTSVVLREVVTTMDNVESALHSLKNTVMLLPAIGDQADDLAESLGYVLSEENVSAIASLAERARQEIDRLADIRDEASHLLTTLPTEVRQGYERALEALFREQSVLEARARQLRRLADRFAGRERLTEREREELVGYACAEVQAFYRWLVDEESGTGLFDVVRQAPAALRVGPAIEQAVRAMSPRAAELDTAVTIHGKDLPARVPGDPGPLTQALSNLIGNALDAIAERAQAETEGYHGLIAVSVTTEAGVTQIKVADNGCGAEAALLQRLRQGESLSTKGKDRGVGLPAVRRTLSRYPLGNLALDSLGRGEGCVATVSFEEL